MNFWYILLDTNKTGFTLAIDIGNLLVGLVTIVIIGRQMTNQRQLNNRISDMQYGKMM
jgi:hypothetical protein